MGADLSLPALAGNILATRAVGSTNSRNKGPQTPCLPQSSGTDEAWGDRAMDTTTLADVSLVLESVVVKWEIDDDAEYDRGDLPILKPASRRSDYGKTVDVAANIEAEISVGGCDRAGALANTARELDRIRRWHNGDWNYLFCSVVGTYGVPAAQLATLPANLSKVIQDATAAESLSGIESDCGQAHKRQVEGDLYSQLIDQLERIGVDCSGFSLNRMTEDEESWGIYEAPDEAQIDPIPDDAGKWWAVDNRDDDQLFITCRECGEETDLPDDEMNLDHCSVCGYHADGTYEEGFGE